MLCQGCSAEGLHDLYMEKQGNVSQIINKYPLIWKSGTDLCSPKLVKDPEI